MSTATTIPDYQDALDDLARTIRKHRQDCQPHETARQLLEYEAPGHSGLVGVNFDATRAALYHESDGYVVLVSFGPDGLGDGGPIVAEFEDFGSNVFGWVRSMEYFWGWLNPRFR